jgi:hypothetical protein
MSDNKTVNSVSKFLFYFSIGFALFAVISKIDRVYEKINIINNRLDKLEGK